MFTFSLNDASNIHLNSQKAINVAKLVNDINEYNKDVVGDAYMWIATGNTEKPINLSTFRKTYVKRECYDKKLREEKEIALLTEDEINQGYDGVDMNLISDEEGCINDLIAEMSSGSVVEEFLNKREELYFAIGEDVWRLLELTMRKDKLATKKLRSIIDGYKLTDFFRDFLSSKYNIEGVRMVLGC